MTQLLDEALAKAKTLPPEMQDDIARLVLTYAGDSQPVVLLTPAEEADLAKAEAEADRGDLATDEQMQAIWSKHRP